MSAATLRPVAGLERDASPAGIACVRGSSVLRALPAWTHLHEFRIEPAQDVDKIGLRSHDRVAVFVNSGNFIESRAQQGDVALPERSGPRPDPAPWNFPFAHSSATPSQ